MGTPSTKYCVRPSSSSSVVNIPTMPEENNQDLKFLVLDPAQEAVVIDAIVPEFAQISLESLVFNWPLIQAPLGQGPPSYQYRAAPYGRPPQS